MKTWTLPAGAILVLPLLVPAAQPGPPLPADDLRLYQLFFGFHDGLSAAVQSKKTQDAAAGVKMETAVAQLLKVDKAELGKLNGIAHALVAGLDNWQRDLKTYLDQSQSQQHAPDPAKLREFDQKKQQLVSSAVQQLSASLSASSWNGLRSYINNEYRLHTSTYQSIPGH